MNHIVVFLVIIFMLSGCSEEQVPEQKLKPVSAIELKKTNSFKRDNNRQKTQICVYNRQTTPLSSC